MSTQIRAFTPTLKISQSEFADANSGIFQTEDLLCIIDPGMLPAKIQALTELVKSNNVTEKYIILTHGHWDHLLGANDFPEAKTVTHADFKETTSGKAEEHILSNVARFDAHFQIQRDKEYSTPKLDLIINKVLELKVGDTELQLMHAPGHTKDQIVIHVPGEGLLWASDMLSDLEIPYVMHSLSDYEQTLALLEKLEVSALVPGHGTPTKDASEIKSRFQEDQDYLSQLRQTVTTAIEENLKIEDTLEKAKDIRHRSLTENHYAHRLNVESAYLELGELSGSKKYGWKKDH